MSPLILNQHLFLLDVSTLIAHAASRGYIVTAGECWRSPETQLAYFNSGRSKVKTGGNHGRRLAIDLNIFLRGELASLDEIRPLGEYWEKLNPLNRWGGNFSALKDGPHFERNYLS